jgi:hypothetical protein
MTLLSSRRSTQMKKTLLWLLFIVFCFPGSAFTQDVIFSGQVDEQFDLFGFDLKTGKIKRLTNTESDELMPVASPDGKLLAFISDRQGAMSLYIAELANPDKARYVSAGIGAYANPVFSSDGKKIIARYAPDPEEPLKDTRIIELDYNTNKQKTIIDSKNLNLPESSETIPVLGQPLLVSENLMVYVVAELIDEISGRLGRSTLYLYDSRNEKHIRIGGGESYYTQSGRAMGFKAVMPTLIDNSPASRIIAFAAIRGNLVREPMKVSLSGSGKGIIKLDDPDFFGPLLVKDHYWIYGITDENGLNRLVVKKDRLNAPAKPVKFPGQIIYPTIVRP